jgi:hypothetical protein
MKKLKIFNLMLTGVFALAVASCDKQEDPDSVITSYAPYSVIPEAGAVGITTAEGDEEVITFKVALDAEKQMNDISLHVTPGASSTAEEGVDFELAAHDFEVPAFGGQDSIEIEVHILQDYEGDEENETIYLTFSTTGPSGVVSEEILVATVVDSDIVPLPSPDIVISAAWSEIDFPIEGFTGCDIADFDVYVYDETLSEEMSGFGGATASCPEEFSLDLSGAPNGTYYVIVDLWDYLEFSDFGELGPVDLPIQTTFSRSMTAGDEVTSLQIDQVVDTINTDAPVGAPSGFVTYVIVAEIHYADGVYTIVDQEGNEAGALRVGKDRIAEKLRAIRATAGITK